MIELWCSRSTPAIRVHSLSVKINSKVCCFLQLPRAIDDGEVRKFLAITEAKESLAWCVDFSNIYDQDEAVHQNLSVRLLCHGPFPSMEDIHLISAVDPMGWRTTINGESLDVYTREVLVTVSKCGHLQTWTTNLSTRKDALTWLNLSTVQTNISDASLVHGTSERKVALGII